MFLMIVVKSKFIENVRLHNMVSIDFNGNSFQNPVFEAGRSEGGEIWFHIIWGNSTHLKTVRSDNDLRNALSTEIVNFGASVDFTSHKWSTTILPFVRVKTTLKKTGAGYPNHPFPIQRADTIQDKCMKPTECSPTSSGARGARFLKQSFANLGTVDHLSITCRSLSITFWNFNILFLEPLGVRAVIFDSIYFTGNPCLGS